MTTQEKNAAISRLIIAKVYEGMSLTQAIDAVLGKGTTEAVIDTVYHTLRGEPVPK